MSIMVDIDLATVLGKIMKLVDMDDFSFTNKRSRHFPLENRNSQKII